MLLVYLFLISADTDMMPPYPSPSPAPPASILFGKTINNYILNVSSTIFHYHGAGGSIEFSRHHL